MVVGDMSAFSILVGSVPFSVVGPAFPISPIQTRIFQRPETTGWILSRDNQKDAGSICTGDASYIQAIEFSSINKTSKKSDR